METSSKTNRCSALDRRKSSSPLAGIAYGCASAVLLLALLGGCAQTRSALENEALQVVSSPDGRVDLQFRLSAAGTPSYSVRYDDREIVMDSPLGLTFAESGSLTDDLEIIEVARENHDETYPLVAGSSEDVRNHYNEITVSLREKSGEQRRLDLVFRAYDDGAALRYKIPDQPAFDRRFEITDEHTTFRFPANHKAWVAEYGSYTTSQEHEFEEMPLGGLSPDAIAGLPVTIERDDGLTLAISEAHLTDYAGMYVGGTEEGVGLRAKLSPLPNGNGVLVRGSAPHVSPWRVVMVGERPGDLIESNLIVNLNDPSAIEDASWIDPGKVLFPWWPDFRADTSEESSSSTEEGFHTPDAANRINYDNQVYYTDFAAEYGIEYIEMEPPWYGNEKAAIEQPLDMDITTPIPGLKLPKLLDYAHERDVRFLMWAHWKSLDKQMDEAFSCYEKWGAAGVKIDFMNRDDQEMVNWYHEVLEAAARHHLLVYFHGAYKPTGIRRTWPNLLTREAVMGLEYNKWSKRSTPEHNVTLPFTRMLVGAMDYTPGGFTNVTPEEFKMSYSRPAVMTTRAQQLAMYVVYLSPLQMVADWPGAYRGQPAAEFIREVPTSWDETRVIDGKIGDYVAMARRRGAEWFVGAMTDENGRELTLPLDFLGAGTYTATIYADGRRAGEDPKQVAISTDRVSAGDELRARLASGGGYAAHLTPASE